ncbi:hypothetical protein GCM10023160_09310 [Brachybacterium paraconglomeratum]|uniref:hypothetical protein n=1 Tax=Brachybacterium paraconglomeratum TaxID=173362 RepID=UPI0031E66B45
MSRTIIARGAALAAATMLALTACGGTDEAPAEEQPAAVTEQEAEPEDADAEESADTEDTADTQDAEDTEEAADDDDAAGDDAAGAEAGTVVEIGTEFTDEETGDVITIVSAVRGNDTEYYMASDNPDGEMIYLEVKVTAGDQFGGVISQQDFFLDDGGEEVNYASTADDELTAAGFTYFEGTPRSDGEGTGYIGSSQMTV